MDIKALEEKLGVTFKNKGLLKQALTHRSYINESQALSSNERLEFLGDSVLSFLVSDYLYQRFPKFPEGKLTNTRSAVVRSKTLAKINSSLNVGQYLFMSKGEEDSGGRNNGSILADTFEAILGAIFLDQGVDSAKKFLEKHLFPLIADVFQNEEYTDYKSKFQEETQKTIKESPVYRVLQSQGPDHNRIFTVGVFLQGKQGGEGTGKSKQEAEQEAAKQALAKIQTERL